MPNENAIADYPRSPAAVGYPHTHGRDRIVEDTERACNIEKGRTHPVQVICRKPA